MDEYIITEKEIKEVLDYIKNRNTLAARKILKELKPYTLRDKLKTMLKGKSNIVYKIEIEEILNEYEK